MRALISKHLHDGFWSLSGLLMRVIFQSASFILLARTMGSESFGIFSGMLALVITLSAFVEMGGYSLVVKEITAAVRVRESYGESLSVILLLSPIFLLILALLKFIFLSQVLWQVLLPIAVAEFLFARVLNLFLAIQIAKKFFWRNTAIETLSGALRLAAVLLLRHYGSALTTWAWLYLIHAALIGLASFLAVWKLEGAPKLSYRHLKSRIRQGLSFATALGAQSAYTDFDKTLLNRFSTGEVAGFYAGAYKFLNFAYLPIGAVLNVSYPKFFSYGQQGMHAVRGLLRKLLPLTVLMGLGISLSLFFGAAFIPVLLGEGYLKSVGVLRLLCFIPLVQSIYYPLGDALTGSGYQAYRTKVQLSSLAINLSTNLLLIPLWNWKGAAISTIVSEAFLLTFLGAKVWRLNRNSAY